MDETIVSLWQERAPQLIPQAGYTVCVHHRIQPGKSKLLGRVPNMTDRMEITLSVGNLIFSNGKLAQACQQLKIAEETAASAGQLVGGNSANSACSIAESFAADY
ncbi:MAG: hypothetical protein QNJ92_04355 [Alphaproteobacteria bacterium]|nr:hypothetical protein [Alphaproteobacteria bacterium]